MAASASMCNARPTFSMNIQAMDKYGGRAATALVATEINSPVPLSTTLWPNGGLGTDEFYIVRMAAPETTRKGTVGINSHCPAIQPLSLFENSLKILPNACTLTRYVGNQDTGGVSPKYSKSPNVGKLSIS